MQENYWPTHKNKSHPNSGVELLRKAIHGYELFPTVKPLYNPKNILVANIIFPVADSVAADNVTLGRNLDYAVENVSAGPVLIERDVVLFKPSLTLFDKHRISACFYHGPHTSAVGAHYKIASSQKLLVRNNLRHLIPPQHFRFVYYIIFNLYFQLP